MSNFSSLRLVVLLVSSLLSSWALSGCADKRLPLEELVREFLYSVKSIDDLTVSNSPDLTKLMNEKYLRQYMRISELNSDQFMEVCVPVGMKAIGDAGFFQNNAKGRALYEEWKALNESDQRKNVTGRCQTAHDALKKRAEHKETVRRQNMAAKEAVGGNGTKGGRSTDGESSLSVAKPSSMAATVVTH